MHAPSVRTRRIASLSAAPVAVLVAGLLVWQGSNAAFTAETHNSGNNWETGTVLLTDDDGGSAMFAVANLTPGQTGSRCIVVTANTSVAGLVRTYVNTLTAGGLQDNITVSIEEGTGSSFADPTCASFTPRIPAVMHPAESLQVQKTDHGVFADGILDWTKGPGIESTTYKFTWKFDVTGLTVAEVNALQGKNVQAEFEWELQNS